jgi:hypothetical protein
MSEMESRKELLTAAEAQSMLLNLVCECGYVLTDSDQCFEKIDNGFLFVCPKCGDEWRLTEAGKLC